MHRKFAVEEGDHLTMLNVYESFIKVSTATPWKAPSVHHPVELIQIFSILYSFLKYFLRREIVHFCFTRDLKGDYSDNEHISEKSVLFLRSLIMD